MGSREPQTLMSSHTLCDKHRKMWVSHLKASKSKVESAEDCVDKQELLDKDDVFKRKEALESAKETAQKERKEVQEEKDVGYTHVR